jgi:pilus assembly protein TadC
MGKLFIVIISVLLYSCSAQYHLNKAIKKGFKCDETGDTIRITTLDSIPVIVNDTIVWEKFITTKDTVVKYKNVYVPKTRIELKREYKIKIKTIYKDRIVEKAQAKAEGKKAKMQVKLNRPKGNLNLLFVGVAIGLLLSWLWKYAKKSLI